jgi:STE24 endopeptidase
MARGIVTALSGLTLALVVAAVVVNVWRPLAPDLGPAPEPRAFFEPGYISRAEAYRSPRRLVGAAALALTVAVPAAAASTAGGRRLVERAIVRVQPTRPAPSERIARPAPSERIARPAPHERIARPALGAGLVAGGLLAAIDVLASPLAFWSGFIHEGAYGLRTQGLLGWAADWVITHAPVWVLGALIVAAGYRLARALPRAWPPVAAASGAVLAAGMVLAGPVIFEPLWFDTRPLPQGSTRAAVESVISRSGADVDELLVADASRRTTRQNAYLSGLGPTRRAVLYDTLLAQRSPQQVAVLFAHELGHARHRDLARGALGAAGGVVVAVYAVAALLWWRTRTGRQASVADPRAVAVVVTAVLAFQAISLPLQSWVSRRAEAAADLAALELTDEPGVYRQTFGELAKANLSDPVPPRWSYRWWASHPMPAARLEMGRRWPRL